MLLQKINFILHSKNSPYRDTMFTKIFRDITPPAINNTLLPDINSRVLPGIRALILFSALFLMYNVRFSICPPRQNLWIIPRGSFVTFTSALSYLLIDKMKLIDGWRKSFFSFVSIFFSFFFLIGRTELLYSWSGRQDCVKRKTSRGKLVYKLIRSHDYGRSGKVVF